MMVILLRGHLLDYATLGLVMLDVKGGEHTGSGHDTNDFDYEIQEDELLAFPCIILSM